MDQFRYRNLTAHSPASRPEFSPRLANKYLALHEFNSGVETVQSMPLSIQVARNNQCNFKCVYCADHRPGNSIPRSSLSDEAWEAFEEIVERADAASFHGISEFMIDKEFFRIVEWCARAGLILSLNTNGSVCTDRHLETLANYPGSLAINFSIDAATESTFRLVRGWDFHRLLENIQTYVRRLEHRRGTTYWMFSFVIMRRNVREMAPLVPLAKSLGIDSIKYYPLIESAGMNWTIPLNDGTTFDYSAEQVDQFPELVNQEIENTRRMAVLLGMDVELPAPLPTPEPLAATSIAADSATGETHR